MIFFSPQGERTVSSNISNWQIKKLKRNSDNKWLRDGLCMTWAHWLYMWWDAGLAHVPFSNLFQPTTYTTQKEPTYLGTEVCKPWFILKVLYVVIESTPFHRLPCAWLVCEPCPWVASRHIAYHCSQMRTEPMPCIHYCSCVLKHLHKLSSQKVTMILTTGHDCLQYMRVSLIGTTPIE